VRSKELDAHEADRARRPAANPIPFGSRAEELRGDRRQRYDGAMSLAQIEYFVAVAEEGHVGRAARTLRVAQPAVSRQIKRLEDELGAQLFFRLPRGMRLSGDGHVFLHHARLILSEIRVAREAIRNGRQGSPERG
jgi:hypothetical protein